MSETASFLLTTIKKRVERDDRFQRSLECLSAGESVVWDGCLGSCYALWGATLSETTNRPILLVVSRASLVERAVADFQLFSDAPVFSYPLLSTLTLESADEVFLSEDADFGKRLRVLKALDRISTSDSPKGAIRVPIIATSLAAAMQPVPSREQVDDETILLRVGAEFSRDELLRWLSDGGFHSTTAVELPGEYSVRGHIVDIFAIDWERPVRVEFFGDEIDSLRSFDIVDQRSISKEDTVRISRLRTSGEARGRFIDRLPNDAIVLFRETDEIIGETSRLVSERRDSFTSGSSVSETMNALYRRPAIHAVNIASGTEFANLSVNVGAYSVERLTGDLTRVEKALNETDEKTTIGIVCASNVEARRLSETFRSTKPSREERLGFVVGSLAEGFDWREGGFLLIGSDQLFGRTIARRSAATRSKRLSKIVDSFMELTPGDLVIHVERGLARYLGVETIKKANQREDHLKLEFADSAYLYVPASKIGKIQRYVGSGKSVPKLAKLNGTAWSKQKKEVQQAVWALASEMLELQAARETLEGIEFPPDGPWQSEFESLFPYRETDDQLAAIDSVKGDMERSRPMDRLLCGDVGFGKTEVALRASFKAVEAGYQAAILVPTTVLAEQHYRTFSERASAFPVRVASLSRYSSKKEQAATIEKLKSGEIDIVIGTHRLVQKDVQFKNLGLAVIDEEQKFGVKDKEKLKKLRGQVDVLTMTATPIPRTLHFSLLGVRDISNLATPPADRLPPITKVLRYNEDVVRGAILRELNRGGQVYFLHNQVFDIEEKASELRRLVPEAKIRVGHAQMPVAELESTMRDFVLKRFDVLVCTTIVESGLDIPNANTIIINKANRFGLAELHQLRGRVGREKKQAYCYLALDANQTISSDAAKRLRALEECDKLGSGFQIAMKDLEIRGAGNILGTEQSGHIAMIGYEMYCDFLDAAIRALKNQPQKLSVDVEIDLPGSAILSDEYVPDSRAKIDFYRRLDRVSKVEELVELRAELLDRFGPLPLEAERLFVLSQIRLAAFQYRVKSIQLAQFDSFLSRDKMLAISFRAPTLTYRLQEELKKRGVALQLVENENGSLKGYVKLPGGLFGGDGNAKEDELLTFALDLFLRVAPSSAKSAGDQPVRPREKRETRPAKKVPRSGESPLGDALKRVKSAKK